MRDWENRIAVEVRLNDIQNKSMTEQLHLILKKRLSYELEYIPTWKEAMIIGLEPQNILTTYDRLFNTMNTVWEVLGDSSSGIEWYMKRVAIGKVFVCTEANLLKDKSEDFKDSWKMLDEMLAGANERSFNSLTGFGTWGLCSAYKGLMFNLR